MAMKSAAESTVFSINKTLTVHGRLVDVSYPRVMGILNVTPDSFYDGGRYISEHAVLRHVEKMMVEGAGFIDVGGYSSRPGAAEIPPGEELNRVLPTIRLIVKHFPDAIISIDTFRSTVAKAAVEEGAGIINDISGGSLDPAMFTMAAELQVPYILMHMRGTPATMNQFAEYDNLLKEMIAYFSEKIQQLHQLGVKDIIVDPGFGFAKTIEQNFSVLSRLDHLKLLGKPILAGLSRKSMFWRLLNIKPEEALNGTTAGNTVALLKGASILRVHDVREAVEAVKLVAQLNEANRF